MTESDRPTTRAARSLIVPVYKNEANIPGLLETLGSMNIRLGEDFEVVFVVDGSPDHCAAMLFKELKGLPYKAQVITHSRNYGSFTAIRTGMEYATGQCMAVMSADLQEPPELIYRFFGVLESDETDVVFGRRTGRSDPFLSTVAANLYWWMYRKLVLPEVPGGGVDVFACNRMVRDSVLSIEEPNGSLIAQVFWVGFRRSFVPYQRQPRTEGVSSWNRRRRFRYFLDSLFSYSDFPVMILLWLGVAGCVLSIAIGTITLVAKLLGLIDVTGYTTIVLLNLFFGFALLVSQGILGCYVWRTLENSKRRPLRIVSGSRTNFT